MQTEDPKDKRYENKYWELTLMVCYFLIPFIGLQRPLKSFLDADELRIRYLLLLLFVGGNIMTSFIFILNDKNLKTKTLWTAALVAVIVLVNLIV